MMGHRLKTRGGMEYDVISKFWRHMYCILSRPGVCHAVKKGMSKRIRKAAKEELRKETWNE